MPRRHAPERAALALAPLAFIALAACQAVAPSPALTDPKEILTKSVVALRDVKTFHVDADLTGKVNAGLGAASGSSSQLDLTGTKGTLDVDVAGKKVHATGSMPALLNSAAELIVLPDAAYYKLTGPLAQTDKFTKVPVPSGATASDSPADPAKAISDLQAGLDKLPTPPTKLPDEKCGDADCYHVQVKLTAADLQRLASQAPTTGVTNGDVTLDVWSRKSDVRPVKLGVNFASPDAGTVTLTLNLTYDVSINVVAPPPDQVTEGSPLSIPSLTP